MGDGTDERVLAEFFQAVTPTIEDMVTRAVQFFSSRRRHTRLQGDWSSTCALPIWAKAFKSPVRPFWERRRRAERLRSSRLPRSNRETPNALVGERGQPQVAQRGAPQGDEGGQPQGEQRGQPQVEQRGQPQREGEQGPLSAEWVCGRSSSSAPQRQGSRWPGWRLPGPGHLRRTHSFEENRRATYTGSCTSLRS